MLQKNTQLQLKFSAVISLKGSVDMIQVRADTQIQCCGWPHFIWFHLVAWTMSLLSLTFILCLVKSLQRFWNGLGKSLELYLTCSSELACSLFMMKKRCMAEESLHILCVSQCVKRWEIGVYFNIMNGCILGSILLRVLGGESAQTLAFREGMSKNWCDRITCPSE